MSSVYFHINHSISRHKKGELIFATDYRGKGSDAAVRKALSRLVKDGRLKRLAQGIYYVPKIDPLLGELNPSAEEVAKLIAKKEKVRIRPAGAYALNKLGLSTQVPTKLVYITDGVPRQLKIGKMTVKFKATTSKKLSMKGELSGLIIQALEELDLDKIDKQRKIKITELLLKEDPGKLKHDLKLAPGRIHDYIVQLLKAKENDRMAKTNR